MISFLIITPIEHLQDKINSVLKFFKNANGIYISLNKSQESIENILRRGGIDTGRLFFIDCVSSEKTGDDVLCVEPNRLDLLKSAIDAFMKNTEGEKFVIIDSLSTLLIYNDHNKVAKFVKELTEYGSKRDINIIALSPKTEEEELLIKVYHFFNKVLKK